MSGDLRKKIESIGPKGMKRIIVIFIVIFLIIILFMILGKNTNKKDSYAELENRIESAAMLYFSNNPFLLPTTEQDVVTVEDYTLINQDYLKELSSYIKNEECNAKVEVTLINGDYSYRVFLSCGNNYSSNTLAEQIFREEKEINNGDRLYTMNGISIFRGQNPNNYLSFANKIWRIVSIEANNIINIVPNEFEKNNRTVWDDRYNIEAERNLGISNYSVSRAKEHLEILYKAIEFTNDEKTKLVNMDLCISSRGSEEILNDGSIECAKKLENQKIGLLTINEYINASLDSTCRAPGDLQCQNYNYLTTNAKSNWWTITPDKKDTYHVYLINNQGKITSSYASVKGALKYKLALNNNAMYKSGNGTVESPYTIR